MTNPAIAKSSEPGIEAEDNGLAVITPPRTFEFLRVEAGSNLSDLLAQADDWNHYYTNLREGLNNLFGRPNESAQWVVNGIDKIQRILSRQYREDPTYLEGAKGFNEVAFQRFRVALNEWRERFSELVPES